VTRYLPLMVLTLMLAGVSPIAAHDHGTPAVEIVAASAPAMTGQDVQLVFLTLRNRANMADRLVHAVSPVASKVELRAAPSEDGQPKGVAGLTIGPGEQVVLTATGPHLELTGLKRQLLENQVFKLALEFEMSGRIVIDVLVGAPAAGAVHQH